MVRPPAYYTGQQAILIGSPAANRGRRETDRLIGFFVNTLVLRFRPEGDPTVVEVLRHVREIALEAYGHQTLPFDRVLEDVRLDNRDADQGPLFRVRFALQNVPLPALRLSDVAITPVEVQTLTAVHDLKLSIVEQQDGLRGALDSRTHLFLPSTIERMAAVFHVLLCRVIAAPDERLSALRDMLAQAERGLKEAGEREQRERQGEKLRVARRQLTRVTPR